MASKKSNVVANKEDLIISKIVKSFADQSRKGIKEWREALAMALNPKNPRRDKLHTIYDDLKIDAHYLSQKQIRTLQLLSRDFMITNNTTGEFDEEKTKLFETSWFYKIAEKWVNTKFEGTGLIQIKPLEDLNIYVSEIPRRHLVPEKKLVSKSPGSTVGVFYDSPEFQYEAIQLGGDDELGLLNNLIPLLIWKRNAMQAWAEFIDRFGQPFRIATTNSSNSEDLDRIEKMLDQMGAAAYGIFPEGTTIDFKEVKTGDAFNVFDMMIQRIDEQISKALNGGTMLSDNGSSNSQSETQFKIFEIICKADNREFKFFVNDTLRPILDEHGFGLDGFSFGWDESEQLGMKDKWKIAQGLLKTHDIPDDDLTKAFGFTVTKKIVTDPPLNFKKQTTASSASALYSIIEEIKAQAPHYGSCCGGAISNERDEDVNAWFGSFSKLFTKVFKGEDVGDIPINTLTSYVNPLLKGLKEGFKDRLKDIAYNAPDHRKLAVLQANLFRFSAASNWQQMQDLNKLAKEAKDFTAFKQKATEMGNIMLPRLQTEFEHTRAFSQGAASRLRAVDNKDISDLVYRTVGDSRVRPEHARYDGLTAPVDSPVWDWLTVPNGWRDRCDIEEVAKGSRTLTDITKVSREGVTKDFQNNPARLDHVFANTHNYYKDFPDIKKFGRRSFGLEPINKLLKEDLSKYPAIKEVTQEGYEKWWDKEVKRLGRDKEDIVYTNYFGINQTLPRKPLLDKFAKSKEYKGKNRQGIAAKVEEMLKNPDEVWMNKSAQTNAAYNVNYLKRYKDDWYVVVTNTEAEEMVKVISWYKVEEGNHGKFMSGLPLKIKGL